MNEMIFGKEIKDLYDSERAALESIRQAMQLKHMTRRATTIDDEDAVKRAFTSECVQRCAEIGLVVDVLWVWKTLRCPFCSAPGRPSTFEEGEACPGCSRRDGLDHAQSPDCSYDPDNQDLYWIPKVVVTGRTEALKEYDHDRQKFEVTKGLLDGRAGYIREDGTLREDPKKRDIY